MAEIRVLEIKESVFADNDRQADALRKELKEKYKDVAITPDDYNQSGSGSAPVDRDGFMNVDDAITEDLPFNQ